METFILGFVVVILAILGMAVGVLFGRPPLKEGGCGNVEGTGTCSGCRNDFGARHPLSRNKETLS